MTKTDGLPVTLQRPTVLILSDDATFAHSIVSRWHTARSAPMISILTSRTWHGSVAGTHDLIITGLVQPNSIPSIPSILRDVPGKPIVCVSANPSELQALKLSHLNLLVVELREDWIANLIVLCNEILRRIEAMGRARRAEQSASESQRYASLGRYMLDMRPGVNDALTSILGNADLLLLEPGQDVENMREQIETIHRMSLRLNEIMQRFSSLAIEIQATANDSEPRLASATSNLSPNLQSAT